MGRYKQTSRDDEKVEQKTRALLAPIPIDKLWDCDIAVIEDQLYTDRALTDPMYAEALGHILEAKRKDVQRDGC